MLHCRLTPIVPRLSELLGTTVLKADDCIGDEVKQKTSQLQNGQVLSRPRNASTSAQSQRCCHRSPCNQPMSYAASMV